MSAETPQSTGTSYQIKVIGARPTPLRDLYHRFLRISWPAALAGIVISYLGINGLFAVAYYFVGGVTNMPEGSLLWAFFFSVQTMGTIGYGAMYPASELANVLVVLESVVGMLLTALFTGLVFAKFSQPVGRIVFSRYAVITQHEGKPTLMLRVGNERGNRVVEAQVKIDASITTTTKEGNTFYRTLELDLVRSRMGALSRAWNVMHLLEAPSPLAELDAERAEKMELELLVTVTGLDDTTGQMLHGQRVYEASALKFGMRLADGLSIGADGSFILDTRRFHDIEPEAPKR